MPDGGEQETQSAEIAISTAPAKDRRFIPPSTNNPTASPSDMARRFPPPWTVEQIPGGFKVVDASGQSLAYVYGLETKADADIAKVLTMDEARRIASNIAKLPRLLGKK